MDARADDNGVVVSESNVPEELLAKAGVDWPYIVSAVHALASVGMASFKASAERVHVLELGQRATELLELISNQLIYPANEEPAIAIELPAEQELDCPPGPSPHENSRILNVHKWSDHREVNSFVDQIYNDHFSGGNEGIRKRQLKVLLLNLYVNWCDDQTLETAFHRNVLKYTTHSRYNELHISQKTIDIVDRLLELGFIGQAIGYKDRETGIGKTTRVWPEKPLVKLFEDAKFGLLDIGEHKDRETIILRDNADKPVEFTSTKKTDRMAKVVRSYNALISQTFVDIPQLDVPIIGMNGRDIVHVSQSDKFTRRVFNRGDKTFRKGGRFYGGWWQRCSKEWRKKIYINDQPTNELDFSALHIVMLYAKRGIDYWRSVGTDPYEIPLEPSVARSPTEMREVVKRLLLVAVNALDDKSAFKAFRNSAARRSREKHLTNKQLAGILAAVREKHYPIAADLASDAGIDLMNLDSQITETIVEEFVSRGIPVLLVHDSYIVPLGYEDLLQECMYRSFQIATGIDSSKVKDAVERLSGRLQKYDRTKSSWAFRGDAYLARDQLYPSTRRSSGYVERGDRFQAWLRAERSTKGSIR